MSPLLPGGTICILGGGQLGRMTTMAARRMGYRVVTLDPTPGSPAGQVADRQIVAAFDDARAVDKLATQVDVATLEFENLPVWVVERLAEQVPVRPGAHVLRLAQDRVREKSFLREHGIPVPAFAPVDERGGKSLDDALTAVELPAVLKTATLGYDGKGQRVVRTREEARQAYGALSGTCILEQLVPFACEISVIVARDVAAGALCYEPAENVHVRGILDTSTVPAAVDPRIRAMAHTIAQKIAHVLDMVGVLAVEMFVTSDGAVLVNEMAPRPHNSGHWSIEACAISQFEQQVRTTVGGIVGATDVLRPASTANLMGDLWANGEPRWERVLAMQDVTLHLYGKAEARPGRKMGHITALGASAEEARSRVLAARAALSAP